MSDLALGEPASFTYPERPVGAAGIVIHHRREEGERLQTLVVRAGALKLDPPGLRVTIETFFP